MIVIVLGCLALWSFHFRKLVVHLIWAVFVCYIWYVRYCIIPVLIIYFLLYFYYVKVRKPIFLHSCSYLISKSVTSWLKIRTFLPDLYHSFPISSLSKVAPKIAVQCNLVVVSTPCFTVMSLVGVVLQIVFRVPNLKPFNCVQTNDYLNGIICIILQWLKRFCCVQTNEYN